MITGMSFVLKVGLLTMLPAVMAAAQFKDINYDEAQVPPYELPDPLVSFSGDRVQDVATWRTKRRAELLAAFTTNMYGKVPDLPPLRLRFETKETDAGALDGLATRKQVMIHMFDEADSPRIDLLIYVPNKRSNPVPAFLCMSYGNQSVGADPGVIPSRNTVTKVGQHADRWPVRMILERGYAVATFAGADIEQDRHGSGTGGRVGGWREGIRGYALRADGREEPAGDEWGTIAAWAWGMSRALDYLVSDADIDAAKVVALGHSRTGKTALWAAAQDERFAIAISNNSGEGGAALTRRIFGETIKTLPAIWFAPDYKRFAGREADLPFDQHLLIALIAPRPVYVASATDDLWSDPKGEFLSVLHAESVYGLFGLAGLGVREMPRPDHPVGVTLGYHIRTGKHNITPYDWHRYLDFADRHFQTGQRAASKATLRQGGGCRAGNF